MSRFEVIVVLVRGSGSGIGRASAIKFASEGASVVIGNRNEKAGQETVNLIQEASGKASFCRTDVTKLENNKEFALMLFALEPRKLHYSMV